MRMTPIAIAGAAMTLLAPAALAQVFVVGGGAGSECYEATREGDTPYRTAIDLCDEALTEASMTRGNKASTYVNRGILKMREGFYDDAIIDYDSAIALKSDLGEAYLNRAAALIYLQNYSGALASLDRAIELETSQPHAAYYNRAIAKENIGDLSGAYFDFRKALELKPEWDLAKWQLSRFTVPTENG